MRSGVVNDNREEKNQCSNNEYCGNGFQFVRCFVIDRFHSVVVLKDFSALSLPNILASNLICSVQLVSGGNN